ncbi:alpha/beta hydrolase-fold protein [Neptunicella marina]|uniref:Esterase n=1 Tax=Neptunicella marina TaxID=2125989 RepID=A0A8J6J0C0_9ALTE|nr:alpha/beta hydrolase-fold protein [Neptunicella marina]MBC3767568.1 hypothetical protein [Neptunicella marina]
MNRKLSCLMLVWLVVLIRPVYAQAEFDLPDWLSVSVKLPDSYDKTERAYPAVYVLSAAPFYLGDYHKEATDLISGLHRYGYFPEVLVVNVQVKSLYDYVANQPEVLRDTLVNQLVPKVHEQYRTGISSTLVGFSYSAAFTSIYAPSLASQFEQIISISPVFSTAKYSAAINQQTTATLPELYLAYGNESLREFQTIKSRFNPDHLQQVVFAQENHQSVLLPALRGGLLWHFRDYRKPGFNQTESEQWNSDKVRAFLTRRNAKYQLQQDDTEFSQLCTGLAQDYMAQHKLDAAFELWKHSQSRFRSYFLHQYALGQSQAGELQRASKIYVQMAMLSPKYPLPDYQKLKLTDGMRHVSVNDLKAISDKVRMMTTDVSEQEINDFAYVLLEDKHNKLAIQTLDKGISLYPSSLNLLDSLADAYVAVDDKTSAKVTISKALAQAGNDRQKAHFNARLIALSE